MPGRRPGNVVARGLPLLLCGLSAELAADASVGAAGSVGSADDASPVDLASHDVRSLQRLMDELAARPCPLPSNAACGWRVLSVSGGSTATPVPTAHSRTPPASSARPPVVRDAPAARGGRRFSNAVPAGFESLAARRRTELDVRIGGVTRVRAGVSIDSATLRFDDPVGVAAALRPFVAADPLRFEDFVARDQALEVDEDCFDGLGPRDCLTGNSVDFAFVPHVEDGWVDLALRKGVGIGVERGPRRLPPATASPSLQANARAVSAYLSDRGGGTDVAVGASASWGAGGVFTSGSWSDTADEGGRLDSLYLAQQFDDHRLRAGTLEYRSSGAFLFNRGLVGADWSRSFATLLDRETLFAEPVEVELTERSVVQLVVDGIVRHSETLDAGLRAVPSDALPFGTYELEIRVRDAANGLRVETRPYSRTRVLPPPRMPEYAVTVGSPRAGRRFATGGAAGVGAGGASPERPGVLEVDGDSFASARVSARLSERYGVGAEVVHQGDTELLQLQLTRVDRRWQLQLEGIAGDESALGAALRAGWSGRAFSVTLDGLRFTSDRDLSADESLRELMRPDTRRVGVGVGASAGRYTLGLRADRIDVREDGARDVRGRLSATLRRRLASGPLAGSAVSARWVDDGMGSRAELRLDFVAREPRLRHHAYTGTDLDGGGDVSPYLGYSVTLLPEGIAESPPTHRWSARADTVAREDSTRIGVGVTWVDRFVDLGLSADAIDTRDGELSWRGLATVATQVASDGRSFAAGAPTGNDAGIIVDVDGGARGEAFDIVVDGIHRGTGRVGTSQFVGLRAFRTHEVLLLPRSLASNGFDSAVDEVTLYPGNVHRVEVDTESRYLLVTSLVDAAGTRLTNVRIDDGERRYFVLGDGIVQIEVVPFDTLDVDLGDGGSCTVEVPDNDGRDLMVAPAPLLCL